MSASSATIWPRPFAAPGGEVVVVQVAIDGGCRLRQVGRALRVDRFEQDIDPMQCWLPYTGAQLRAEHDQQVTINDVLPALVS